MTNVDEMINVMAAYANGEHIEFRDTDVDLTNMNWSYIASPTWNWHKYEYRVTPSKEKPKKFMTNRQLAELMVKGYGEWSFNTEELDFHTEVGYGLLNTDKELDDDILIRPWGSKELRKPTVDIYEEYVSRWNRAFNWTNDVPKGENKSESRPQDCPQSSGIKDYSLGGEAEPSIGERFMYDGKLYECIESNDCAKCDSCLPLNCNERKDGRYVVFMDVSKKENTTASEDSSSTQEEGIGVHKRTPQEIADFFNCYVAMDKDGLWNLYEGKPMICEGRWEAGDVKDYRCVSYVGKFFLDMPQSSNWRTLYRPHLKPIVMEEE